jgi:hypothetical protein
MLVVPVKCFVVYTKRLPALNRDLKNVSYFNNLTRRQWLAGQKRFH